ncbi:MAG: indole-3-glycerol phosphate synthase TrpC [Chitinophagaceae bacterium]|nr:indole-3-glycerol phosphate synthase TrpC [Chitinophagaceae bacterium]
MSILAEIKAFKIEEVKQKKELYTLKQLENSIYFNSKCVSLKKYIADPNRSGIIAEFKRKSPSKGFINKYANAEEITIGYMQAGASALSVLTDEKYFGAIAKDFSSARKYNYCPVLRKDFIVDEFQIIESKSIGADAILLIAAMLTPAQIKSFTAFAQALGLEVLLEVHTKEEILENQNVEVDLIGINNRNLNNFEVNIEQSIQIAEYINPQIIKVSESGIDNIHAIKTLKEHGFQGFLMGEYFMKQTNPGLACRQFIQKLKL